MALTVRDEAYFQTILSAAMLKDPKPAYVFDQFVAKEFDFDRTLGDTIELQRYPYFGDVGMSQVQRQLSETNTVGILDPVAITTNNVTLILQEYGGPYNGIADHVAPLGVTEKVARRAQRKLLDANNPESFVNSIGGDLLKDDYDRWHDRTLCDLYLTSPNSTNPGGAADAAVTNTDQISTADLATIKERLQNRFAPTWDDGLYMAIVSPRMEKHLRLDDSFRKAVQFGDPRRLFRGELGIYEGFRFMSSTNLPTETVNALTGHLGIFFGPRAVGFGEALAAQVRRNKTDDYDRFFYLVWITYKAYAALDTRFIEVARTFAS